MVDTVVRAMVRAMVEARNPEAYTRCWGQISDDTAGCRSCVFFGSIFHNHSWLCAPSVNNSQLLYTPPRECCPSVSDRSVPAAYVGIRSLTCTCQSPLSLFSGTRKVPHSWQDPVDQRSLAGLLQHTHKGSSRRGSRGDPSGSTGPGSRGSGDAC